MTDHPNWIEARTKCNLDAWLDLLSKIMRTDVNRMNAQIEHSNASAPTVDNRKFGCSIDGSEQVTIVKLMPVGVPSYDPPEVRLSVEGEVLRCTRYGIDSAEVEAFDVEIVWDADHSKCQLRVRQETLEPWQISKRALEPLFFD